MKPINTSRLVLGAVVAWLIFGTGEAIHLPMLFDRTAALEGVAATEPGALGIVVGTVTILVATLLMMWVYVVMRGPYGPGPTTALRVGLLFGFFTHVLPSFALWMLGAFPMDATLFHSVWGLLEVPIGMVAGAALYKEPAAAAATAGAAPA